MIGAILAALALQAAPDPIGARLRDSAEAAQALQGPLDGAWVLKDRRGRILYHLEITDPADGGAIGVAWRDARARTGVATKARATPRRLTVAFGAGLPSLSLQRSDRAVWRGLLTLNDRRRAVVLERG